MDSASLKIPLFFKKKKENDKRIRVAGLIKLVQNCVLLRARESAADRVTLITTRSRSRKTDFCARMLTASRAFCISNYHQLESHREAHANWQNFVFNKHYVSDGETPKYA